MSRTLEDALRKSMIKLGHAVERVIGTAKSARVQVSTRSGVQPIMALESLLPQNRLKALMDLSVQKLLAEAIPNLKGQNALEIGEGQAQFAAKFLASQADLSVSVEIGGASAGRQGDVTRGFVVRAQPHMLPFPASRFNYFVARIASPLHGDIVRTMRELGRIMNQGGQGAIVDYHPFGLFAKQGQGRLKSAETRITKLEDYYKICRQSGLRIVDVREAFVDDSVRNFFSEEEIQAYRNLKGTPLLVFLFVYKPKVVRS